MNGNPSAAQSPREAQVPAAEIDPDPATPAALAAHALDVVGDLFVMLDREWRFTYLNRHALEIAGEPAEALLGKSIWEKYPGLVGTELEAQYRRAMAGSAPVTMETRGILSGRWYEMHLYPSAAGLTIHGRDIGRRQQLEQALRTAEERHRLIAELTSDYAYECDVSPEGVARMVTATEGFIRVTGYTVEELVARGDWPSMIHPDDRPFIERQAEQLRTGERQGGEVRIVTKAGAVRWIRFSAQPIQDAATGRVVRLLGAVQDVTERKQAEIALQESERRLRLIAENTTDVIFAYDMNGRLMYVNPAVEGLTGYTAAELMGEHFIDWTHPDDAPRMRQAWREVFTGTSSPGAEFRIVTRDGRVKWCGSSWGPLCDRDGRQVGVVIIDRDITERKRAEERLSESSQRLQALSRRLLEVQETERRHLARELHDEIGQALTAISLHLSAAVRAAPPEAQSPLAESRAVVAGAIQKVRDLSMALRPPALDLLGLEPALNWLVERLGLRPGVAVEFFSELGTARLPPDTEIACFRVAQEALTNVARHARASRVSVELYCRAEDVSLTVRDDGIGFDVVAVQRGAAQGGNFGLLGMKERAEFLGGRLDVIAAPGRGTTIHARFPLAGP